MDLQQRSGSQGKLELKKPKPCNDNLYEDYWIFQENEDKGPPVIDSSISIPNKVRANYVAMIQN